MISTTRQISQQSQATAIAIAQTAVPVAQGTYTTRVQGRNRPWYQVFGNRIMEHTTSMTIITRRIMGNTYESFTDAVTEIVLPSFQQISLQSMRFINTNVISPLLRFSYRLEWRFFILTDGVIVLVLGTGALIFWTTLIKVLGPAQTSVVTIQCVSYFGFNSILVNFRESPQYTQFIDNIISSSIRYYFYNILILWANSIESFRLYCFHDLKK